MPMLGRTEEALQGLRACEARAPRPLERYKVYLADDGQIVVDTTKVFLQPSQWEDAEAGIPA